MKLWLSDEVAVNKKSIVGIFDLDTVTVGKDTLKTLKRLESENKLTVTTGDIPVSLVLCEEGGEERIFLTRNAVRVLRRRAVRRGMQ
ncbi:MAG: hypothetical protein IJF73_03905 [Clostridia bacterium]|nr:hypothetical protein [Clostridia bacterium]